MSSKIPCYLRTLRREWGLTQKELAMLVPRTRRSRVSDVERGRRPPKSSELLAYALIFGRTPQGIFRRFAEELEDAVMRGAAKLDRSLADDVSRGAARKIELLKKLSSRARLAANDHSSV